MDPEERDDDTVGDTHVGWPLTKCQKIAVAAIVRENDRRFAQVVADVREELGIPEATQAGFRQTPAGLDLTHLVSPAEPVPSPSPDPPGDPGRDDPLPED